MGANTSSSSGSSHVFQAPTGTRDLYPAELNRLRYVQEAWRRTSVNHGFEEIDGPTFEHLDLYTVKSGEGIVSELFSFERFGGEKKFALRPEFTPTLARMYAAKAGALPKPTKWFWMQNCYRAERPQRGRLREFCQWNCDIIGDDSAAADAEVIACAVGMFESLGLTPKDVRVRLSHREAIAHMVRLCNESDDRLTDVLSLLDRRAKVGDAEFRKAAEAIGFVNIEQFDALCEVTQKVAQLNLSHRLSPENVPSNQGPTHAYFRILGDLLDGAGIAKWVDVDFGIVRGLAYYTGMVFEVHEASGAERAIAGGGRYDKLIEMFGGPPTPAVGFGMGDVVLSLVLQDKGLMPSDDEIAVKLGLAPDVFVFAAENKENAEITAAADGAVVRMLAELRRAGLHARRSYKSTRNIGKLLGDATKARARYALIIETGTMGQLKDLKTGEQKAVGLGEVVGVVGAKR